MNSAALHLGLSLYAAVTVYDIVGLSYTGNGFAEYTATCADGHRFEVVYDAGGESYRLSLREVYATFDLAAARACSGAGRAGRGDQMGTGWGRYLPSSLIPVDP